jgi:hypothetical protein
VAPPFDLSESLKRAEERFGSEPPRRKPRSDRGRPRLPHEVLDRLHELLAGQERPPVREITSQLAELCASRGLPMPARATIYEAMRRAPTASCRVGDLPAAVRATLYNLDDDSEVPGHQLAFHCLNYGGLEAASYAAGLPWLALYQAARLRGWRARSRGLLDAILRSRGLA